jgi:hypothetical protein
MRPVKTLLGEVFTFTFKIIILLVVGTINGLFASIAHSNSRKKNHKVKARPTDAYYDYATGEVTSYDNGVTTEKI